MSRNDREDTLEVSEKTFAAKMFESQPSFRAAAEETDLFTRLTNELPKVEVDGEILYRLEGDLLLDEDQLAQYALTKSLQDERRLGSSAELIGIVENGKIVRWAPGKVLSYAVIRSSFVSGQDKYDLIVRLMKEATSHWESTCGVKFEHREDLDGSNPTPVPNGVVFTVREFDSGGQFIASAFFPNDPTNRRRVLIDPSFFTLEPPPRGFSQVGVLRHELGHVLGFRHEHIRSGAPPACPDEPMFGTTELTAYDPQSVMHYFCGGVGSRELRMTQMDINGSRQVYGPPLNNIRFIS